MEPSYNPEKSNPFFGLFFTDPQTSQSPTGGLYYITAPRTFNTHFRSDKNFFVYIVFWTGIVTVFDVYGSNWEFISNRLQEFIDADVRVPGFRRTQNL
jgi:hypothetical protein